MTYHAVKESTRMDSVFGCVKPVADPTKNLSGFVGRNQLDSLPFGYMRLESKAGLAIEIKKELIEAVEEFDYETCQEYEKVAYED